VKNDIIHLGRLVIIFDLNIAECGNAGMLDFRQEAKEDGLPIQ